jgi:hypothetical protein
MEKPSDILFPGMPRLGFGCGDLYGGPSHAASARLLSAALDAGIRYFDVARLYGNGSAEAVLGGVLPAVRDRVIIVSKAGIMPWSMLLSQRVARKAANLARSLGPVARALVPEPLPAEARHGAFDPKDLRRSLERSLRELRTDYLDILLLHECAIGDASRDDVLGLLTDLRAAGKIRCFGIATDYPATVAILRAVPAIARVVQFASDALNRNVSGLGEERPDLVVTHSAIKPVLASLMANPASLVRFGVPADDRSAVARMLLADALEQNPRGIVLFSTSRPERIAAMVQAGADEASGPRLRELLAQLPAVVG